MNRGAVRAGEAPDNATAGWAARFRQELIGNILPFWTRYTPDRQNKGFFGTIASDLTVVKEAPRSLVLSCRILWTFSAAARLVDRAHLAMADWAFDYIADKFWDREFGGLYWMVDYRGVPTANYKQTYGQAFGLYALAEYYRVTGSERALDLAKQLFRLVEQHCHDADGRGYFEGRCRRWQGRDDVRLSGRDLNSPKSMNTHLHVMEAYSNLLRVWRDPLLEARHRELLEITLDRIVDAATGHFRMFFDESWTSVSGNRSFGHDIEGSWLLCEAAEVLGDAALVARARETALKMARTSLEEGLDRDGSMFFEADGTGRLVDANKHWWVQAEAVVGFYNAYELSGDERFLAAAHRAWDYIEAKVVDRVHGEWHAKLRRDGVPMTEADDAEAYLVGPWKCPYHNARVCYEMLERLAGHAKRKAAP